MFKLFLASTAVFLFTMVSGMVGCTAYIASGGVATVSVDTQDVDLWIPVPTRLVDLGLDAAWTALPAEEKRAMQSEIRHGLADIDADIDVSEIVRELTHEIATMPNGALVEVTSDEGDVWVGKRSGKFQVRVDSPDAKVRISVPARAADRVTGRVLEFAGL